VVKLESIDNSDGVCLNISGADLLDGTPVLDIKPYVPYVDSVPEASNAIADAPPLVLPVRFSALAESQIVQHVLPILGIWSYKCCSKTLAPPTRKQMPKGYTPCSWISLIFAGNITRRVPEKKSKYWNLNFFPDAQ